MYTFKQLKTPYNYEIKKQAPLFPSHHTLTKDHDNDAKKVMTREKKEMQNRCKREYSYDKGRERERRV